MAKAWDLLFGMGTKEAEELSKDTFVIKGKSCAAYNLFKRWGMPDEEIHFVCDSYCAGDVGQAKGFSDRLHFQHTARLMRGDPQCQWAYSMKPCTHSESAVPSDNLEENEL
jgi:hypothetical protein